MDVIKSILATLLVIAGMFWFVREGVDDPDYVTIEYQCSKLDTYEEVPKEVIGDCNKRFNKK
jgi:hypothetical protein